MGSKKNDRAKMPRTPSGIDEAKPLSYREIQKLNQAFGEVGGDALDPLKDVQGVNHSPARRFVRGELDGSDWNRCLAAFDAGRGACALQHENSAQAASCTVCGAQFDTKYAHRHLTFCVFHVNDERVETDPLTRRGWLCGGCRGRMERLELLVAAVN